MVVGRVVKVDVFVMLYRGVRGFFLCVLFIIKCLNLWCSRECGGNFCRLIVDWGCRSVVGWVNVGVCGFSWICCCRFVSGATVVCWGVDGSGVGFVWCFCGCGWDHVVFFVFWVVGVCCSTCWCVWVGWACWWFIGCSWWWWRWLCFGVCLYWCINVNS